ncbi:Potato proteinase inhibitor type I family protein [Balamuthia mandrillaris]
MSGKRQWPELVGKPFEEVKAAILKDDSSLKVVSIPQGAMVTADFREDRVRVYVNKAGKCIKTPRVG